MVRRYHRYPPTTGLPMYQISIRYGIVLGTVYVVVETGRNRVTEKCIYSIDCCRVISNRCDTNSAALFLRGRHRRPLVSKQNER